MGYELVSLTAAQYPKQIAFQSPIRHLSACDLACHADTKHRQDSEPTDGLGARQRALRFRKEHQSRYLDPQKSLQRSRRLHMANPNCHID